MGRMRRNRKDGSKRELEGKREKKDGVLIERELGRKIDRGWKGDMFYQCSYLLLITGSLSMLTSTTDSR